MTNTNLAEQKLREVEKALEPGRSKELANELRHAAFNPSQHPEFAEKLIA
jgi:hypothetical protein